MRTWNKSIWKAAVRIAGCYERLSTSEDGWYLPQREWSELVDDLRRWNRSQALGWYQAAARQRMAIAHDLERLRDRIHGLIRATAVPSPAPAVTTASIYDELLAVAEDFDEWSCDEQELVIVTEPIRLEGIELGRFEIRLDLQRLDASDPYRVTALTPNPAASSDGTTHPHVHDSKLCSGEGRPLISAALKEGRLYDFATVVDRVLHTYARGSAYVELANWSGTPCHDCDTSVDPEDASSCQACDETICGDCRTGCAQCGDTYCSGCIDRCPACEESTCSGCLNGCASCNEEFCESCLTEGLCHACWEQAEEEREEEVETESDADVLAVRVGEAPISS